MSFNLKKIITLEIFIILFLTIISFLIIKLSPSLLAFNLPDSEGYVNSSAYRSSIYPAFIEITKSIKIDIVNMQILFLSLSLSYLCMTLIQKKIKYIFIIFFFLAVSFNIYYTSFAKTLLPECIFFSLINFALSLFLKNRKKIRHFIYLGISLGLILSIKKIGIVIVLIFIILFFSKELKKDKFKRNLSLVISSIILIFSLENFLFFQKHSKRSSVFVYTIIGKLLLISGNENFDSSYYDPKYKQLLNQSGEYFKKVNIFLNSIDDVFLKAELLSDYETIAQYQFHKFDEVKRFNITVNNHFKKDQNEILLNMLKYNFKDLLELSFYHYVGMWSAGSKQIYLNSNNVNPPYYDSLKKSSGGINEIDDDLIKVVNQLFKILMYFSLLGIFFLFMRKSSIKKMVLYCFIISQFYLISVSFVNLATLRYLMPVYAITIFQVLIMVDYIYKRIRKN